MMKTIRSKVIATISLLLGMNLIMAAVLFWGVQRMERLQRDTMLAGREIRAYMALAANAMRYAKELDDDFHQGDSGDELREAKTRMDASLDALETVLAWNQGWADRDQALRLEVADDAKMLELRTLLTGIENDIGVLRSSHPSRRAEETRRRVAEIIETRLEDTLFPTVSSAIESENQWIDTLDRQGRRVVSNLSTTAIVIACLSVFISLIAGGAIATVILRPIQKLKRGTEVVGKGDLSYRVGDLGPGEFGQLARYFDDMVLQLQQSTAALQEAYQLQSDFLSVVSHDLRSPLNAILGFTELVSEQETTSDRGRQYLARITACARKLLRLINDILDFSKLRSGHVEVHTAPFALTELVEQIVEEAKVLVQDASIGVTLDIEQDLGDMWSDDLRVRQIIGNLVSNAVKFTDQGSVVLRVRRVNAKAVRFMVIDTGIGISKKEQTSIFEPFRQVNSNDARRGGTGLGLAIVSRLVALLGGEISLKSKRAVGSTFTVVLPDRRP